MAVDSWTVADKIGHFRERGLVCGCVALTDLPIRGFSVTRGLKIDVLVEGDRQYGAADMAKVSSNLVGHFTDIRL